MASMHTTGSTMLFDLVHAAAGPGAVVVARAVEQKGARVAWLITLEGSTAWEPGRRRFWLRPGSVLVFDPQQVSAAALPARSPGWRGVVLAFAGPAAVQHARHLERKYGSLQHLDLRSAPVSGARALVAAGRAGARPWQRERRAADWVAGLHRHLLDHHLALPSLFSLRPTDPRLVAFAGRTIKDLALEMSFSRTYLTRKLAVAWGQPPSAVLRALRVRKAATLLRETELPAEAIAAEAGFDSVSGLFTAFHREYGMTPGSFRRRGGSAAPAAPGVPLRRRRKPVKVVPPGPRSRLRDAVHAPDWDGPYFRLLTCGEWNQARPGPVEIALNAVVKRCAIVITLGGGAVFESRGSEHDVGPGTAVAYAVPMNARWRPRASRADWHRIWLQFHGPLAEAFFEETISRFGNVQQIPANSEPVRMAREIAQWVRTDRSEPAIFWSQHAYRWLVAWREHLERTSSDGGRRVRFQDRESRLLERPPKSLQEYADQVGYSISYVSQKLKLQWNMTPGQVLRSARLDVAAQLLRTTTRPVHEIAAECGYKTPSAFILAFKRREGLTPLVYRHQQRK